MAIEIKPYTKTNEGGLTRGPPFGLYTDSTSDIYDNGIWIPGPVMPVVPGVAGGCALTLPDNRLTIATKCKEQLTGHLYRVVLIGGYNEYYNTFGIERTVYISDTDITFWATSGIPSLPDVINMVTNVTLSIVLGKILSWLHIL